MPNSAADAIEQKIMRRVRMPELITAVGLIATCGWYAASNQMRLASLEKGLDLTILQQHDRDEQINKITARLNDTAVILANIQGRLGMNNGNGH